MNLRQLRSLHAIYRQGSFAAAGDRIGLTHAAISMQMQQLESQLGVELFDRSSRPVELTAEGIRVAHLAAEVLDKVDHIQQFAGGAESLGSISIGLIPTSVPNLLPRVLTAIREQYPDLQVKVKSGLSGELSAAVVRREIDFALLTTPAIEIPELEITEIAAEPFYVIGPRSMTDAASDEALIRAMPYIAFNRRTWVGQHIAARLQQRGIHVNEAIEIDSLPAIENLVADGFGVSIVPRLLHTRLDDSKLVQIPFCDPVDTRRLALVEHVRRPRSRIDDAIKSIFANLPNL